ncbi:pre-mRNA-splicing factor CWC25 [Sordaria brevicollis]|uniref:Pre-mRNA-splicing factor CWC25 n=1 Tax=Sordaria brevicollis TaxID=83679 RepID=A0AAE0P998_SORBR|nr:pre-mRNA-splicing factor CWC25 [Sordaria brevicollis]
MGSGDLNMKKSWHPQRSGNVAATQKAEAEAIAERKKLQQRLQEIEEERRKEEIQKALEAAGGKRKIDRVEWMYSGPTDGQAGGDSAENEAYLLGKRRIDKLLQDNDTKKALSKQPQQDLLSAAGQAAPTIANARDVATKIREDPLLAIKRQEQQAYEAMMNDPIKRRQLLASMGIDDSQIAKKDGKEERRHKHRSHHHHHRSERHHRDRDDERERDRDRDRDRDRHSRRRRSDSRDRSRSRSPRRRSDDDEDRSKRRRRDSPDRSRRRDRDESPRSRRDNRDDSRSRRHRSRDRSRSRSRSPGGRSSRRREYSRERENGASLRRDDRNRDQRPPRREDDRPRYIGGLNRGGRQPQPEVDDKKAEEERAKKLAAMQAAATDLDKAREERLKALAEAERAEREADEKARQQNKKYRGGDAGFMSGLHSRAADMKIADRMNGRV